MKHDRPGQRVGVARGRPGGKKGTAVLTMVQVEVSPEEE